MIEKWEQWGVGDSMQCKDSRIQSQGMGEKAEWTARVRFSLEGEGKGGSCRTDSSCQPAFSFLLSGPQAEQGLLGAYSACNYPQGPYPAGPGASS